MPNAKASDTKFRNAKAKAAPYKLADRDGLYLHIMPRGAKSWRYDYRLAGARYMYTIGRYPDVGLGAARRVPAPRLTTSGRTAASSGLGGRATPESRLSDRF